MTTARIDGVSATTATTVVAGERAPRECNYNTKQNTVQDRDSNDRVTASAPGKVILFGEHFVVHGTSSIICAINRRVHVTASQSDGIQIRSGLGTFKADSYTQDASDVNPVLRPIYHIAKEVAKQSVRKGGITLDIESDIPPGAGLGSSSACCVAAAAAAFRTYKVNAGTEDIIKMATSAERTVFPNASGADTAASALGGMITYNKSSGYSRTLSADTKLGFRLVVANSGMIHNTEEVVSRVSAFKDANPAMFADLCAKEASLISNVTKVLLKAQKSDGAESDVHAKKGTRTKVDCTHGSNGGVETAVATDKNFKNDNKTQPAPLLGNLASLNQEYLRTVGVSNHRLDSMIETINGMTYGSKITGAGSGGCIIAFVDAPRILEKAGSKKQGCMGMTAEAVADQMFKNGYVCFAADIDNMGCRVGKMTLR